MPTFLLSTEYTTEPSRCLHAVLLPLRAACHGEACGVQCFGRRGLPCLGTQLSKGPQYIEPICVWQRELLQHGVVRRGVGILPFGHGVLRCQVKLGHAGGLGCGSACTGYTGICNAVRCADWLAEWAAIVCLSRGVQHSHSFPQRVAVSLLGSLTVAAQKGI